MRKSLAILLGKSISFLTKSLTMGGGSAAPGLYALKIHPDLVEQLVSQIPTNIVITGTNGKTTTSRMLAHFAKTAGLKVIRNHTGSNLERGIASTLIQNFPEKFDLGVWELDEAAFNLVVPKIKPQIIVFLNVFRDQLDRYGEIDTVVKKWSETLQKLNKKTVVLVNGDDANCIKLKSSFKGKVYTFGVKDFKIVGESILHKREEQKLDFEAREVKLKGLSNTSFQLSINNKLSTINLPLPGVYHIYDTVAAITTMSFLSDVPMHKYTKTLKSFSPAFCSLEIFYWVYIFLIKNPAGATQVFETIAPHLKKNDRLLLALNDNLADGTDVSWIWDANFESLQSTAHSLQAICSGTRSYDLANRLKYAGFDPKRIIIEPDLERAFKQAKKGLNSLPDGRQDRLFILPTYTAMLELQSILTKSGIKKHYWKET